MIRRDFLKGLLGLGATAFTAKVMEDLPAIEEKPEDPPKIESQDFPTPEQVREPRPYYGYDACTMSSMHFGDDW